MAKDGSLPVLRDLFFGVRLQVIPQACAQSLHYQDGEGRTSLEEHAEEHYDVRVSQVLPSATFPDKVGSDLTAAYRAGLRQQYRVDPLGSARRSQPLRLPDLAVRPSPELFPRLVDVGDKEIAELALQIAQRSGHRGTPHATRCGHAQVASPQRYFTVTPKGTYFYGLSSSADELLMMYVSLWVVWVCICVFGCI